MKEKPIKQCAAMRDYFAANAIKNVDIAKTLGIGTASVSNLLRGRDCIGKGRAHQLHEAYGFSVRFLVTGEGELFDPNEVIVSNPAPIAKPKRCPSVSDLQDTITILRAQLLQKDEEIKAKEDEASWLRAVIDRLTGKNEPKPATDLQQK